MLVGEPSEGSMATTQCVPERTLALDNITILNMQTDPGHGGAMGANEIAWQRVLTPEPEITMMTVKM